MLFLCSLCAYLALYCVHADHLQREMETLMPNVLVVTVPEADNGLYQIHLQCRDDIEASAAVVWKKDDAEVSPLLSGNQVTVLHSEWEGGNYSCHRLDGRYLNHTLVLVQRNVTPAILEIVRKVRNRPEYIQCSAVNYNGTFHCSWKRTPFRSSASVVLLKSERVAGVNMSCCLDNEGSGVTCQDPDSCLFSEEKTPITLSIYIRSHFRLETFTTTFNLWEITKPEPIPVKSVSLAQSILGNDVFQWECPPSWEPCSFFSLRYRVKVVAYNEHCDHQKPLVPEETTLATNHTVFLQKRKYKFCLRAQDRDTSGPYCDWTHYMVKKM